MPRCPGLDASGGPPIYVAVALTCVSDTAQATSLFVRSCHISAFVTKLMFCKPLNFVFFFSKNFSVLSGFRGNCCCSVNFVTDFQSNMHLRRLGFKTSKYWRQELPGLKLQSVIDGTYY